MEQQRRTKMSTNTKSNMGIFTAFCNSRQLQMTISKTLSELAANHGGRWQLVNQELTGNRYKLTFKNMDPDLGPGVELCD